MTAPAADPGHLLPAEEWERVKADATRLRRRGGRPVAKLGRSSFPSVTGFMQAKYNGGAQPAGGPTFGVLHDAETPLANGYAASIASYFTRNTNETSAHFMVGPEATFQLLDTGLIAWHCGNGNTRSIGVEQAGYASFSAAQWETAAGQSQMARVAALMRDIHAAHGIGLYWMSDQQLRDAWNGRIVGGWATHSQCSRVLGGSTHTDPMPDYPLDQLMALASQQNPATTDQEDDVRLVRSNETGTVYVVGEFSVTAIPDNPTYGAYQHAGIAPAGLPQAEIDAIAAQAGRARTGLLTDVHRNVLCRTPDDRTGAWLWDRMAGVDDKTGAILAKEDPKALAAALAPLLPSGGSVSAADLEAALRNVLASLSGK